MTDIRARAEAWIARRRMDDYYCGDTEARDLVRDLLDALTETEAERDDALAEVERLQRIEGERDRIAATLRRTKKERDQLRARIVSATALCGKADMAEAFNVGGEWQGKRGSVPTPDMLRALQGEQ